YRSGDLSHDANSAPNPPCLEDVGIVVIGRNEGERLALCLASIRKYTPTVVYVDSGSTDGSVTTAEKIGAHIVQLDPSCPFTAARARNEGFTAMKSSRRDVRFVQFIDGDCTMEEGWLIKARDFLDQHNNVAVVCGRRRERYPSASIYNSLCDLEW